MQKNEKKTRRGLSKEAIESAKEGEARVLKKALSDDELKTVAGGSVLCGYSGACIAHHQY